MRIPSQKYLLPGVAALALLGGATLVAKNTHTQRETAPRAPPPSTPFIHSIGAEGLVEPSSEDISIAPVVPGLVTTVSVKAQQQVHAGDVLWEQDNRELTALLPVREAEVKSARAAVDVAKAALADAEVQLTRIEQVTDRRAIREEDLDRRRIAVQAARAQVAFNRAALARALAALIETHSDLSRLVVTAPIDGQILKVDVRPGEYAMVPSVSALIVMGNTSAMHVRVDVAEEDVPRFAPGGKVFAMPRGEGGRRIPLQFVRVEPRLIPKKNLTGDTTERVDTRVLQVIYRVGGTVPVYDGELMDVYIDVPHLAASEGAARPPGRGR